jgi:uncharacterized membrane protein YbaN (DUF454 family)
MIVTNKILRIVLLSIGLCATALGILGIFLPLLPTVPLLLLAAACFARSSEHFHSWLLEHPQLGPMLNSFLDGQGIPLRAKITAISLIWISIPVSVLFFLDQLWLKVFLIALGLCVTIYLLRLPLCEASED